MTLENINPVVEAEEANTDAHLFADELEEHVNNSVANACLSTLGTVSSAGSYCTVSTACSGSLEIQ